MPIVGIRGAVTVENDRPEEILAAVKMLLQTILKHNPTLQPVDLASALFTMTADLHSVFPARAARDIGWQMVPLMCAQEIPVEGALQRCIRVLLHWNTSIPQKDVQHVYLGGASGLRPDLKQRKEN
jgi:chorismate mutase